MARRVLSGDGRSAREDRVLVDGIAARQFHDGGRIRLAPSLAFREAVPPGGLAVYRGEAIAAWKGSVLVGTLRSRALHRFELDASGAVASHEVYLAGDPPAGLGRVREVAQGPDGALWVTTSNCDGRRTCPAEGDVVARILPR